MPIDNHSKLPPKISNMVIDNLAEDTTSNETLRACLSVSRPFRHRARTHLFRTIRIDDVGTQYRTQRTMSAESVHRRLRLLLDLMCPPSPLTDQGILPHIREVEFTFSKCGSLYCMDGTDDVQYRPSPSLRYALEILRLLNAPKCWVRSLRIDGSGDTGYGSWLALEPVLLGSLLDLCRSPTLSTLHLLYMTDVPEDILQGTQVGQVITYGIKCFPSSK